MTFQPLPVKYSIFVPSDAIEVARLLGEVFAERDPPAVAVGLTSNEFESFVHLFCHQPDTEQLAVVARSKKTGEMVGALLAEDSAAQLPSGIDGASSKFDPIFDILGQLDSEYRRGITVTRGQSVHIFLIGVAKNSAGQGVGQQLVKECLDNSKRRGYRLAVTESTNRLSQHVFRKLGFVERSKRSYADHEYNGKAVFNSIAEEGGPILMDKTLEP